MRVSNARASLSVGLPKLKSYDTGICVLELGMVMGTGTHPMNTCFVEYIA